MFESALKGEKVAEVGAASFVAGKDKRPNSNVKPAAKVLSEHERHEFLKDLGLVINTTSAYEDDENKKKQKVEAKVL